MPLTVAELTQQALGLSETERAELARVLLMSLDGEAEEGVEEAWEEEIAKRVERIKNGTAKGRPADEVLKDIRARIQ